MMARRANSRRGTGQRRFRTSPVDVFGWLPEQLTGPFFGGFRTGSVNIILRFKDVGQDDYGAVFHLREPAMNRKEMFPIGRVPMPVNCSATWKGWLKNAGSCAPA
jgi:hypothetical protein